jgi:hypothetical protein
MEKMANNKPAAPGSGLPQNRKRTWSASNNSDGSGPSGRHGGASGGDGGRGSPSGSGSSGRQSFRSQQWQEMKRWNDTGYPRQGASVRDSRDAGSRGGGSGTSRRHDQGPPQYPREYGGGHYRGNYRGRGGYDRRYN